MEVFDTLVGWFSDKVISERNKRFEERTRSMCISDAVEESLGKMEVVHKKYLDSLEISKRRRTELDEVEILLTEIKKRDEELVRSKEYWTRTFDALKDCIFIMDSNKRIIQGNKAFKSMFRISDKQFGKIHCFDVISTCSNYCTDKCKKLGLFNPGTIDSVDIIVGKNKTKKRTFVITSNPLINSIGDHYASVVVLRDVMDLKEIEIQAQNNLTSFECIDAVSNIIINNLDYNTTIDTTLKLVCGMTNADAGFVISCSKERPLFNFFNATEIIPDKIFNDIKLNDIGSFKVDKFIASKLDILDSGVAISSDNAGQDVNEELFLEFGIKYFIIAPISGSTTPGGKWGALVLLFREESEFVVDRLVINKFTKTIANLISSYVSNAQELTCQ